MALNRSNGRIRITYLITDLEVGGVPLHLYRLVNCLPKDRVDIRVISLASKGPVGKKLEEAGIPVAACGARSASDVGALWRLWRLLREEPTDILHALLFHANIAGRIIGPLAGIPISRILCEIQTVERERVWHLLVDNVTCRLCRCEIANSPSVLKHLHRAAHVPQKRLRCMSGAVDVTAITAAPPIPRMALGLRNDEFVVMWVGRLDPVKGFEEMLAGFAKLTRQFPTRLVLVGDGAYRQHVEKLIEFHDLKDNVLMLGQRVDVPSLLKTADVFLFPSRTEGLPNALLEAMAAGLPILASDVPGCRDLIQHGTTGFLVESASAEAIARGLRFLIKDRKKALALGAQGRQWVREHFGLEKWPLKWLQFYAGLSSNCDTCSNQKKPSASLLRFQ